MSVVGWSIVVVGGAGAMGRLLCAELAGVGARVSAVDKLAAPDVVVGDIESPSRELFALLGSADAVVLCTPDSVTFDHLADLAGVCSAGSLLVDTSSAKRRLTGLVDAIPESVQYVSLNPLFAPSLGFGGQNVVAVPVRAGDRCGAFLQFLEQLGARVTTVSIDDHERSMAAAQVAAHAALLAYGVALEQFGYVVTKGLPLSTPPQRTLLAMLARIASGSPHVYHDIQIGNGYGEEIRESLSRALEGVSQAASDHDAFAALMERQRAFLGDALPALTSLCAELYDSITIGTEIKS